jgi:hypothetical protein
MDGLKIVALALEGALLCQALFIREKQRRGFICRADGRRRVLLRRKVQANNAVEIKVTTTLLRGVFTLGVRRERVVLLGWPGCLCQSQGHLPDFTSLTERLDACLAGLEDDAARLVERREYNPIADSNLGDGRQVEEVGHGKLLKRQRIVAGRFRPGRQPIAPTPLVIEESNSDVGTSLVILSMRSSGRALHLGDLRDGGSEGARAAISVMAFFLASGGYSRRIDLTYWRRGGPGGGACSWTLWRRC